MSDNEKAKEQVRTAQPMVLMYEDDLAAKIKAAHLRGQIEALDRVRNKLARMGMVSPTVNDEHVSVVRELAALGRAGSEE